MSSAPALESRISTGISGLDSILNGGLTPHRLYLIEGTPGAGKTTLALQFLMAGVQQGESGLYITLSETREELRAVARSHHWQLDNIDIYELVNEIGAESNTSQSILLPAELELGETISRVVEQVERLNPKRVVFDSLSEMRLLAEEPLRYRRQILALKQFFAKRQCTVLLLDDKSHEHGDVQLHSIAHGVITLSQSEQEFGIERRRVRVIKMRGIKFQGGSHDFSLLTGGLVVFPRLVAAAHPQRATPQRLSTGLDELDQLLGGGLSPGTNTLMMGPAGVGKTTTSVHCMLSALAQGQHATYYLFDEGKATFLQRCLSLGMDLRPYLKSGSLNVVQVDPAQLSPGEFASAVVKAVQTDGSSFVVIDSLNAYMKAMPGQNFLVLHMHELLTYLNQQGVITLLVLGQHGVIGEVRGDVDLSYLSDAMLLFRYFEAVGQVRSAVACVKNRTAPHERTIREFQITPTGVRLGEVLMDFEGVLTGLPSYRGRTPLLDKSVGGHPP